MPIRQNRPPTDEYVEDFLEHAVPSAIPNDRFIDWDSLNTDIDKYEEQIEAITNLEDATEKEFVEGVADALMAADDTREWIDFYFELVGERGNKYSSLEGVWKFYPIQRAIDSGDREEALDLASVLQDVGLQYIVDKGNVRDHYRGMLVGMESHARKNRQGLCFEDEVEERVAEVTEQLRNDGHDVEYDDEYTTAYNDDTGQEKTVDFAIFEDGDLSVAFEANCYKVQGSKPSEIRRSYNHVAQRMRNDGVVFVWITDGQGWESMANVLAESYNDIVDVYNLYQADEHLADDLLSDFNGA
ncbi:type II restriction endonuclease [Halomicroarcula sp. S1AR25-4]|uniref:DpnII family type II restriction endonuclease n=1 Tax=Haloarcula sp. S1AR25-4 TaxID=2950538 RepID=UPI0028741BCE|nr:DpnII family type II restriction endonuclease [Halomicroarcula sp. S1AR25-4]MDS0277371.1 type II restriction endonuclease [Halomicroarcula sp. S1AR25-4]